VALYRVYWIGSDGHFEAAENIECASDEEAQTRALKVMGAFAEMEIWLGTQLIAQLSCPPGSDALSLAESERSAEPPTI
jgi:hypothetical protein